MPLFQTPGCSIASGSSSFTAPGFACWGGWHLLEKLSLVAWMSLAEKPPAFRFWGAPESLSLATTRPQWVLYLVGPWHL